MRRRRRREGDLPAIYVSACQQKPFPALLTPDSSRWLRGDTHQTVHCSSLATFFHLIYQTRDFWAQVIVFLHEQAVGALTLEFVSRVVGHFLDVISHRLQLILCF